MRHHYRRFIAKRGQAALSYAREGLAVSALLVLVSAAIMEQGPTPQVPSAALATPVAIEEFDLRLVEALADEEPQAVPARQPIEAPARFHASAIEPAFEPAAGNASGSAPTVSLTICSHTSTVPRVASSKEGWS